MMICGIDPGFSGGISFLKAGAGASSTVVIRTIPMPIIEVKKKKYIDVTDVKNKLIAHHPNKVYLEKVGARPGQGVTSMFSFGYWSGVLEGLCAGMNIPYTLIPPQTWMKEVLGGLPKDSAKSSVIYATRTWPYATWKKSELAKNYHDGMTDSACIAYYGILQEIKALHE